MTADHTGEKIRSAIVGLGRIASSLEDDPLREKPATHAGAITSNSALHLVGGADPDPEKREAFKKRWGVDAVFEDAETLLEKTRPHILHIATPPETHLALIRMAARHGVPLVISEKPLAPTEKEAREAARFCRKHKVRLMVNHERRFALDYVHTRKRVMDKTYGELLGIGALLFMGRTRPPGQVLLDDGTHLLDMIRFLTSGEISGIKARGKPKTEGSFIEASFWISRKKQNPIPASVVVGGRRDHFVFEIDLSFERGRIRVGNGLYEEYESVASPYYAGVKSLRLKPEIRFEKTRYFSGMMEEALGLIRDPKRQPVSSGEDGLQAVKAIREILKKCRG
ncbi:MAG: Gfo/Idh/MocA family oxidoreductase [Spirochaetia bacterium]|nr:Gfo/Idh/MocA family oxidoreductase [Spirochaetia bacterium]